jgi:hypothetical protein
MCFAVGVASRYLRGSADIGPRSFGERELLPASFFADSGVALAGDAE